MYTFSFLLFQLSKNNKISEPCRPVKNAAAQAPEKENEEENAVAQALEKENEKQNAEAQACQEEIEEENTVTQKRRMKKKM